MPERITPGRAASPLVGAALACAAALAAFGAAAEETPSSPCSTETAFTRCMADAEPASALAPERRDHHGQGRRLEMIFIGDIDDRGLYRPPTAVFVCQTSELERSGSRHTLAGVPFSGAAFDFSYGSFVGATRFVDGRPTGSFDPAELFPDHPRPTHVVNREAGVVGGDGDEYDSNIHQEATLDRRPFDGLLVDRFEGTQFTETVLFGRGKPIEARETERSGRLVCRDFLSPEGWDVYYSWDIESGLIRFEVRAMDVWICIDRHRPGCLTTTQFDMDDALFERMRRSETFRMGFPSDPADLAAASLSDFLNVRGALQLERRLQSLCDNPQLSGIERLHVEVPGTGDFDLLERFVLAANPSRLGLGGRAERCRDFARWFERRHASRPAIELPGTS